jgi:hypothetical protein
MMRIDTTYVLTGASEGTRRVLTTDVGPNGLATVLSPLLRLFLRRESAKKYQTVKQLCDGDPDRCVLGHLKHLLRDLRVV